MLASLDEIRRIGKALLKEVLLRRKGVFLGFNTNIDAVIYLESEHKLLNELFSKCPENISTKENENIDGDGEEEGIKA